MDKPSAPSFSSNIIAKTAGNIKQFGGFSENWDVEKNEDKSVERKERNVEMWKERGREGEVAEKKTQKSGKRREFSTEKRTVWKK